MLREQWIRAKYERTEFTGETKFPPLPYTTGEDASGFTDEDGRREIKTLAQECAHAFSGKGPGHVTRATFGLISGFYEGMLWKKGKEKTQYLKRKFVLVEREFTLSYYNKENVSPQIEAWTNVLRSLG